jgi:hypothetical protein
MDMMRPHRIVGDVADGLANGVRGVGNGMVGAVKGAGSQIMSALDKPFTKVTGKEGPHRIVDRFLNGTVDAGVNVVDVGGLRSLQDEGEAIMKSMDQPLEQISSFTKRK